MTEEFIEIVRCEYPIWCENERKRVVETNQEIEKEIELLKKINCLLQDEKVKEFAETIGYIEKDPRSFLTVNNSLCDFLKKHMSYYYEWDLASLKGDKYPIFCYIGSHKPLNSPYVSRKLNSFRDSYWNLQSPGYSLEPSDRKENGKNREEFRRKNADSIIYVPTTPNLSIYDAFYKLQAEFLEETFRTNQGEAKKMLLQRYGKTETK